MATVAANKASISSAERDVTAQGVSLSAQAKALRGLQARIDSLYNSGKSATTRSAFDSYKSQYLAAIDQYNSKRATYSTDSDTYKAAYDQLSDAMGVYTTTQETLHVQSSMVDLPNFKDINQWQAGGFLKNDTFAGGTNHSVDRVPAYGTEKPGGSFSAALLNGNVLSLLNAGYVGVMAKATGGVLLDLITDFDTRSTVTVSYRVVVSMSDGTTSTIKSGSYVPPVQESSGENRNDGYSDVSGGPISLDEIAEAYARRSDMRNIVAAPQAFMVGIAIEFVSSAWTGELDLGSVQSYGAGMAIGTMQNMFTEAVSKAAIQALGITSIPATIGVTMVVGAVLDELTEMALGLDTQFGYGGDYIGTYGGKAYFEEMPGSFVDRSTQYAKDVVGEIVGLVSGEGYASANEKMREAALGRAEHQARTTINSGMSTIAQVKAMDDLTAITEKQKANYEAMYKNPMAAIYEIRESLKPSFGTEMYASSGTNWGDGDDTGGFGFSQDIDSTTAKDNFESFGFSEAQQAADGNTYYNDTSSGENGNDGASSTGPGGDGGVSGAQDSGDHY